MSTPKTTSQETVRLPNGYNGHTELFFTKPLEEDATMVKLSCAAPGKEYLTRWVYKEALEAQTISTA